MGVDGIAVGAAPKTGIYCDGTMGDIGGGGSGGNDGCRGPGERGSCLGGNGGCDNGWEAVGVAIGLVKLEGPLLRPASSCPSVCPKSPPISRLTLSPSAMTTAMRLRWLGLMRPWRS